MYKHIVILGLPRSGTTLLHSLLMNSLPGFKWFSQEISALTPALMQEYAQENILTKRPLDFMNINQILQMRQHKDVKIIFCVRDPRDVICSTHRNVPHDYFIGFKNQYFVIPERNVCSLSNPGVGDVFNAWVKHKDDVLTVRYEELVSKPDRMQGEIFEYVEESPVSAFSDFNSSSPVANKMIAAMNGQRSIDTSSVEAWRKHPKRVWEEFTENKELFQVLAGFGYENSSQWFLEMFRHKFPFTMQMNT